MKERKNIGGPGCSGLLGLLSEMGPFRAAPGGAVLDPFPWGWTQTANIIFVEQPLFVGFSIRCIPFDCTLSVFVLHIHCLFTGSQHESC